MMYVTQCLRWMQKTSIILPLILSFSIVKSQDLGKEIAGWYNDGWDPESHTIYKNNHTSFSDANPYWYNLGTSDESPGSDATDGSIYERAYAFNATEITDIKSRGDLVIPTIGDMATGQINTIFANATARQKLITNLVNTAVNRGYDGWDLNFELGIETGKAAFTAFVNDLADALAVKGKVLDVTTGAFETATRESYWIFDLDGLKTSRARRFKIMAYDNNLGGNGTFGPVGSYTWVKQVLDYMVVQRGLPANKVMLGIANYGWIYKENATSPEYPFATYSYIKSKAGLVSTWDDAAKEVYGTFTEGGINYRCYYNDSRSVSARLDLVNQYGLAGAAFWVLGREDAAIYPILAQKFPTASAQAPYGGTPRAIPGKIEVEDYDTGGQAVAYNDLTTGNSGNTYRTDGVDLEATTDTGGGYNIGWVQAGEWTEYTVKINTAGTYTLQARVSATATGKTFHVEMDGVNVSGTITVPNTGSYQTFQTVSVTTSSLTVGQKVMKIAMDVAGFNINYVNFLAVSNQTPYGGTVRNLPGKIEAEHYDVGGQNISFNDNTTGNAGRAFRSDNVDVETCTDAGAGYDVGYITTGEWLEYTVNVVAGTYRLEARVASTTTTGKLHFEFDGVKAGATISVPNTGGWQTWQTVSTTASLTAGQKILRVYADAAGHNLNYLNFVNTGARATQSTESNDDETSSLEISGFPNPFKENAVVSVIIKKSSHTSIALLDHLGKTISKVHDGNLNAGKHQFEVKGENLPAGLYIFSVVQDGKRINTKLIKQ
jgi:spore germination protein YaaH